MGRPASGKGRTVYVPNDSLPFVDSILSGNAVGGIYAIKNSLDGKVYVGSTKDFHSRWRVHRSSATHGKHHNSYLQAAIAKHGAQSFSFVVLEVVENLDLLVEREQAWLDGFKSFESEKGYNLAPVASSVETANAARRLPEGVVSDRVHFQLSPASSAKLNKQSPEERGVTYALGAAFEANGYLLIYDILDRLGARIVSTIVGNPLTIVCRHKTYEGDNQAELLLEILRDRLENFNYLTPGGFDDEPRITD